MARQRFSNIERRAFFEAHKCRCAYCSQPITYGEMELDHLVPITLAADAVMMARVLAELCLPADFNLNSDTNILVACRPCNSKKSAMQLSAPLIGLLHAKASRIATEVARLREKYSKILSTDRLVLNLVNAMEANPCAESEVNSLLWQYFGRSELKLDFPVRFTGRAVGPALSRADLEDLWDLPVDLWGEGKSGLPLAHDDGREITVHTCREYAAAVRDGFYPLVNAAIKMSSLFEYALAVFYTLENGKPGTNDAMRHPRIGVCDVRFLDKELVPMFGPECEIEPPQDARTFEDLIDAGVLQVDAFSSLSLSFRYGGLITSLREIMRADVDDDGIEEILISLYSRADGGTLGFGYPFFIGQKSESDLLKRLEILLPHQPQVSSCPR